MALAKIVIIIRELRKIIQNVALINAVPDTS